MLESEYENAKNKRMINFASKHAEDAFMLVQSAPDVNF